MLDKKLLVRIHKGTNAMQKVLSEFATATKEHGEFNSAHEAYAVILEELDELWDEIKNPSRLRNYKYMLNEACQVAAMAMRFMVDICGDEL